MSLKDRKVSRPERDNTCNSEIPQAHDGPYPGAHDRPYVDHYPSFETRDPSFGDPPAPPFGETPAPPFDYFGYPPAPKYK